jgi:hypothetical protein
VGHAPPDKIVGHKYNIYHDPQLAAEHPCADLHTQLFEWLVVYEHHLGQKLHPNDYLFPVLTLAENTFRVHYDREASLEYVQSKIDAMANLAGDRIPNSDRYRLTTHCFRRGSSQYRFIYAPIEYRWGLDKCCWWGGWSEGEHVSHACLWSTVIFS